MCYRRTRLSWRALVENMIDLCDRAVRACFRRFGDNADQPSPSASETTDSLVVLANNYRELACYRVTRSGLRYLA